MSGFLNFVFLLSKLFRNRPVLQVFESFDKFSQSFQVMSSYDKKTEDLLSLMLSSYANVWHSFCLLSNSSFSTKGDKFQAIEGGDYCK